MTNILLWWWDLIIKVVYLSSGYITHKAKRIQPEDGLKRTETCSCITYCLIIKVVYLSSGYITHKPKRIQPEDGLKRAETCSWITYCTTQYNKFCCVSTTNFIYIVFGLARLKIRTIKTAGTILRWSFNFCGKFYGSIPKLIKIWSSITDYCMV